MKGITHCIWFDNEAEEAAKFYTSIFKDGKIGRINHYTDEGKEIHGQPAGKVMTVEFSFGGQNYLGLNGGKIPGMERNFMHSIVVNCESQAEIDHYWDALLAGGGKPVECGWLTDRFGVSWQVVPVQLTEMMSDKDVNKVKRVTNAFLKMKKFDLAELKRAYAG